MRRSKALLVAIVVGAIALAAGPVVGTYGEDEWRMRMWMQPPMDTTGDDACLTQRWHQGKALDWQSTCSENQSKVVRFRYFAAAPDDEPSSFVEADGEPWQHDDVSCGQDVVRVARVWIRSRWDGLVKSRMHYGHTVIQSGTSFPITFAGGVGLEDAHFGSVGFGDTVDDSSAGSSCWTGWHVHEDNINDSPMYWDDWNSLYDTAIVNSDSYQNDDSDNWIRRTTWVDD